MRYPTSAENRTKGVKLLEALSDIKETHNLCLEQILQKLVEK